MIEKRGGTIRTFCKDRNRFPSRAYPNSRYTIWLPSSHTRSACASFPAMISASSLHKVNCVPSTVISRQPQIHSTTSISSCQCSGKSSHSHNSAVYGSSPQINGWYTILFIPSVLTARFSLHDDYIYRYAARKVRNTISENSRTTTAPSYDSWVRAAVAVIFQHVRFPSSMAFLQKAQTNSFIQPADGTAGRGNTHGSTQ